MYPSHYFYFEKTLYFKEIVPVIYGFTMNYLKM